MNGNFLNKLFLGDYLRLRSGKLLLLLFGVGLLWHTLRPTPAAHSGAPLLAAGPPNCRLSQKLKSLPPQDMLASRYLYSPTYGWFDTSHLDTGNPGQLIANVASATVRGGDTIAIHQAVREGITGYTGRYWVSGDLSPEQVNGVAFGIYLDWSVRFEMWQGELPRSAVGPLTSFAIEDLPTQYVGFYAAAHDLDPEVIFTCALGGVQGMDDGPPHLVFFDGYDDPDGVELNDLRLTNTAFVPLVLTKQGWHNIPWPKEMRMVPIKSNTGLWRFVDEETWYLNDFGRLAN
jgi:hypothetical protein